MLEITQSTLSFIVLLLTSATFRLILSALLATAQELVASTEKAVEDVAGQLEVRAQQVEKIAGADYFEKLREASGFVWEGMGETGGDDIADRLRRSRYEDPPGIHSRSPESGARLSPSYDPHHSPQIHGKIYSHNRH